MGLFGLFGSKDPSEKKERKELPWELITRMEQLDEISDISRTTPVAIFKHSTRCGISSMVLRQFENAYEIEPSKMRLFYLDILRYRDVSNEVAIKFQVFHQSPQLIVIKNGLSVHNTSHQGIRASGLEKYI